MIVKIAAMHDWQRQEQMIKEFIHTLCDDASISQVGDALFDEDEAVRRMAVRILSTLGHPGNAPALPNLLRAFLRSEGEEEEELLTTLIAMGPGVLAYLAVVIKDDREMERLVFEALDKASFLFWNRIERGDRDLVSRVVQRLAQEPEQVLDFVLFVLSRPLKGWWDTAVLVLQEIGYPRNANAIPLLMWTATDSTPGAVEALDCLRSLEPYVFRSYVLEALYTSSGESVAFSPEVYEQYPDWDTIGVLLDQMGREDLVACGPAITHLLATKLTAEPDGVESLLWMLEEIGPECAFYALPTLIDVVRREGRTKVGVMAWRLIGTFDAGVVAPYSRVLEPLRQEIMEEKE